MNETFENIAATAREWLSYFDGFASGLLLSETLAFGALVAAMGAFFGAIGAHVFTVRNAARQRSEQELRRLNQSVYLVHSTANSLLNFKKDLWRPFHENFLSAKQEVVKEYGKPTVHKCFIFQIDGKKFPLMRLPQADFLAALSKINSVDANILPMAKILDGTLKDLDEFIKARNEWIDGFRSLTLSDREKMHRYFGLPLSKDEFDSQHSDTVEGAGVQLDSAIFFATTLAERLSRKAWTLRKRLGRNFGFRRLGAAFVDYEAERLSGLVPRADEFSSWDEPKPFRSKRLLERWDSYETQLRAHYLRAGKDNNKPKGQER